MAVAGAQPPAAQALLLGAAAAPVSAALSALASQRFIERLWREDAGLWASDPSVQTVIRQRLGWLSIVRAMAPKAAGLQRLAPQLRAEGLTRALLLGMGGSGLFAETCRRTLGVAPEGLEVTLLDTTDPTAIRTQLRRGPLSQLLVIVSSKSGSTAEILALSAHFSEVFRAAGLPMSRHGVVITDAGTPLELQAKVWGVRRLFLHGHKSGAEVGGRFSAVTYFGLVPAALLGADVAELLRRADAMLERCGPSSRIEDNPAAQLGVILGVLAREGKNKLTLLCSSALAGVGPWIEQLIAESTGKQGHGIIPIQGEPLRDVPAYGPDRVFVELQLATAIDRALEAHALSLAAAAHPVIRMSWRDPYDLGGETIKWFIATSIAGSVLGVNPFDEPNVQESKDRTNALLSRFAGEGTLPEPEAAAWEGEEMTVYGAAGDGRPASLEWCVQGWLAQARPGEAVAVLSFLPRTDEIDQALETLRGRLGERLGAATMLGIGPRYLHSTGQLYKGGADTGLFLLLTADEREDLPIPGESFTFGVLKQAQALGDFEAMRQRGRRILRVHFRDAARGMPRLLQALP
jgi:glucose-6-phosphate isomerase